MAFKQNKVKNNLIRIGGFEADYVEKVMEPMVGMEDCFHYRNKAQFPIGEDKQGNLAAGFYAGRTHDIIANTDCVLGVEENKEILECILNYMKNYHVPAYNEQTGKGLVRHVLIRKGFASGEIMVCLVLNGNGNKKGDFLPEQDRLISGLKKVQGMTSISVSINAERTNVIMGKEVHGIWGKDGITDTIHMVETKNFTRTGQGISYFISPLSLCGPQRERNGLGCLLRDRDDFLVLGGGGKTSLRGGSRSAGHFGCQRECGKKRDREC